MIYNISNQLLQYFRLNKFLGKQPLLFCLKEIKKKLYTNDKTINKNLQPLIFHIVLYCIVYSSSIKKNKKRKKASACSSRSFTQQHQKNEGKKKQKRKRFTTNERTNERV
jgi:uncharacterized damage-inducible protein DinB